MDRLTGRDAFGDIVANEEMQIIAQKILILKNYIVL